MPGLIWSLSGMLVLTDNGVGESSGVSSRLGSLRDVMFV